MSYDRYDVVAVSFPFTDLARSKRRPAVVVSQPIYAQRLGHAVLVMITSAKNSTWFWDVPLTRLDIAGPSAPSVVRMKLFSLPLNLIDRRIGRLHDHDRQAVEASLGSIL